MLHIILFTDVIDNLKYKIVDFLSTFESAFWYGWHLGSIQFIFVTFCILIYIFQFRILYFLIQ